MFNMTLIKMDDYVRFGLGFASCVQTVWNHWVFSAVLMGASCRWGFK
jgi:hypothetical protein